ncbi:MAG: DUF1287 domain-containing protein [Pseudomonadota bacterium]
MNKSTWLSCLLGIVLSGLPLPGAATPGDQLVAAAKTQIGVTLQYDGRYEQLAYPGGDVPIGRGVCTDVLIRAYRTLGIDLQQLVHQDMTGAWNAYPHLWQLKGPDSNIDHRRVPNLQTYFTRHGSKLTISLDPTTYQTGDIVTWTVPPKFPHIGIVSAEKSRDGVPLVIHNIGAGTQLEDRLFAWPLTGHYRYTRAPARR